MLFRRVSGTIVGTVPPHDDVSAVALICVVARSYLLFCDVLSCSERLSDSIGKLFVVRHAESVSRGGRQRRRNRPWIQRRVKGAVLTNGARTPRGQSCHTGRGGACLPVVVGGL